MKVSQTYVCLSSSSEPENNKPEIITMIYKSSAFGVLVFSANMFSAAL